MKSLNSVRLLAGTAIVCAMAAPAFAQVRSFDIAAQPVDRAIGVLGRQADVQIVGVRKLMRGKIANGVTGAMTVDQALAMLLRGTGLSAKRTGQKTFIVVDAARTADASAADAAPVALAQAAEHAPDQDIVVTGSRIQRAGFDAPTPTTVISGDQLALGNRPGIGQVLTDAPQFRATISPTTTVGSTFSGTSNADLRGLLPVRTLTLLNGHRFSGSADLNTVPQNLVKRIDVVTGGASAAWGSGAVAGVVNIILDDALKGWRMGVQTGVSSRGDAARYGADLAWGADFAGGRGHIMISGDYMDEKGALNRKDHPNLEAGLFQHANGQLELVRDPNYTIVYNGGSVLSLTGAPRNLVFNGDGSVRAFPLGSETAGQFTIGGGGQNIYDYVAISSPYERRNLYARLTYALTDTLTLWADAGYNRMKADYGFFPETPLAVIMPDNAFLTATAKSQLAAAGVSGPFILGRILDDVGSAKMLSFRSSRRNLEGSLGLDGRFGNGWRYAFYYDHGELRSDQSVYNQRITTRFNNGVDSILVNGVPTCRVNTDAIASNDDPNCQPINLFGTGNISAAAAAYAFGGTRLVTTTKLDTTGGSLHGQPFATWAGPVDIAIGVDLRWEKLVTNSVDPLSRAGALATLNSSATNGGFNVKEGFAEVNVPLLDLADRLHWDVNGAARYSDYSTSGGIWSWKGGSTLRVMKDLLFRAVYSRDIRSPSIPEYFLSRSTSIGNLQDPFVGAPQANVVVYGGGNPNLKPEISHTLTLGGTYAPRFVPRFQLSVDYYRIKIDNVITTITAQDTLNQCYAANRNDPTCGGVVVRNPNGSIQSLSVYYRNLSHYSTRGVDFEASYRMPLGQGQLDFRLLANHVFDLKVAGVDVAGIVGGETAFSTPKWRGTGTIAYAARQFGANLRARYVAGGIYSAQIGPNGLPIANNNVNARTYFDLGLQLRTGPLTWFANVNNLFDVNQPLTPYVSPNYDEIGRYFSGGVKLAF